MSIEIREITNKQKWDDFLAQCERKTFLHSWNWGEFQKSLSNKIWRFGIFEEESLISVALVIKHKAKRGSFLLIPHGPVFVKLVLQTQPSTEQSFSAMAVLEILLDKLKELAKQEKVDFIRISPILERSEENNKLFKDLGFRLRALHTHPESSWKLNIELTEQELLNAMRKSTRYLIKQAQKNTDLEIFQSFSIKDIEIFNSLHLEVVKRQKFVPFSLNYFKKEFESFSSDNQIALFFAKYSPPHQTGPDCVKLGHKLKSDPLWCGGKGKIIAASYGIFWSDMAFYHHAALLPEYKKVPASYLLQWEAIKEAKKRGCQIYDFWGYSDPVKNPKHPYSGPTLFKMGFGGYKEEYVKTQDLVISSKYWINYILETIRKYNRGL